MVSDQQRTFLQRAGVGEESRGDVRLRARELRGRGPAFPGLPGHEPDLVRARHETGAIDRAMKTLATLASQPASYVSEGNSFDRNWAQSFWGSNSSRLRAVKRKYGPEGLFFVHHGVGSEDWSTDDFTRAKA